jgi:LPXTG-motif cell wall-anchored protein
MTGLRPTAEARPATGSWEDHMGRHVLRHAAAVAMAFGATGLMVAMATPAAGDPPGNNGTVKIDDVPFDTHPNNEPHVGCTFQVDFYGYDAGDLEAVVTFEAVPPTAGPDGSPGTLLLQDTVDIGEDAAGGGTDLDAEEAYDLTAALAGITPHAQQGWHVRLTVEAEGSQGADEKHKVFWVNGCGGTTTTTAPHGSTTTVPHGSTTTVPHGSTTTVPQGSTTTAPHGSTTTAPHGSTTTAPGTPTTEPHGSTTTAGAPSTTVVAAEGRLPRTGASSTGTLVAAGVALVALGAVALAAVRLRTTR